MVLRNATLEFFRKKQNKTKQKKQKTKKKQKKNKKTTTKKKNNNNIHLGCSFKTIYNQYMRGILKRIPLNL